MNHADELDILKHYQHGFRKGHSCESQLLITAEDIGRQLDQQHQVDALILDFAKAFDMLPHKRPLYKSEILWSKRKNFKLDTKLAHTKAPISHSRWK